MAAAIIQVAAALDLVDSMHSSTMMSVLKLHTAVYGDLQQVFRRLNRLEARVEHVGSLLCQTMTEVRGLWCYLKDKEKRERQVATVKTLFKMGVSLAPVIGGALGVGVDAVATFAGSTAGAAAVYEHLPDPTNLDAARKVLRGLREVESKLTSEERSVLVAPLRPHLSVGGMLQEVEEAAQILGIDAEAADAGVVGDAAQGEVLREEATNGGAGATAAPGKDERGGLEAGAAAPDSGGAAADSSSDPWEKPKDAQPLVRSWSTWLSGPAAGGAAAQRRSQPGP